MTTNKNYPKSFSHIGITVPNIKEAVKFYSEVMGWYIIMRPSKVKKEKESPITGPVSRYINLIKEKTTIPRFLK